MKFPFGFASFRDYLTKFGDDVQRLTGKSKARQTLEIVIAGLKGFTIKDYYLLPLYNGDGWDKMNSFQYDRLNGFLNKKHTGVVPFDKWVMENFFHAVGIASIRSIGFYHRDFGLRRGKAPLRTVDDVRAVYTDSGDDLVFKPADQGRGEGVNVTSDYDRQNDTIVVNGRTDVPLAEFVSSLNSRKCLWMVQKRLRQHPELEKLHPKSLNTLRINTLIEDDGTISAQLGVLKIGGNGSYIDNTSAGGFYAMIDLETGVCTHAYEDRPWVHYQAHPDTGAPIAGLKVPFWQDAKTLVVAAHHGIPYPRDLGWDVAITADGPLIIEVNAYWPPSVSQPEDVNLMHTSLGEIYHKRFGK